MAFEVKVLIPDLSSLPAEITREEMPAVKRDILRLARQYRGTDERTIRTAWRRIVGGEPDEAIVKAVSNGDEIAVRLRT